VDALCNPAANGQAFPPDPWTLQIEMLYWVRGAHYSIHSIRKDDENHCRRIILNFIERIQVIQINTQKRERLGINIEI
jgi:hypothetical protein